jgi:TolB-like protein/Tfp pilus assembly protein PilF
MSADAARLIALAEAVADGTKIDWADAEASVDPADADLVRELRLLAGVADVHRPRPESASLPSHHHRDLAGTIWGPLRLQEQVGVGNFGAVYRARDSRLARDVALKLLHSPPGAESASSIVEEGRLLARVRHPHVISVYGADRFGDQIGIWMEFIQGRTLETVLRYDGPLGAREAALIGIDLCGALAAVHAQGLVHRDVKTQNVMREDGGRVVLMDFGAGSESSLSSERQAGTPVYMAPELFEGGRATPRSDIYSLGVLLFRLVTGEYPVNGRMAADVEEAHARRARRYLRDLRPDLPGPFVNAVERALAVDPRARFESAGAMEQSLATALLPALPALPAPSTLPETTEFREPPQPLDRPALAPWRWIGGRTARVLGVLGALLALVTVAGAFVAWRAWDRSNPPPLTAQGMQSLAIRPLVNLSGDASQMYFAAGLTDLLLSHFGSVHMLRIVAVPSGPGAHDEPDSPALARRLGVDGVFEGSVQRSAGRVRVSARLVRASSGAIVWGRTYEGSEREAFNLQSQIAADVTREIGLSLTTHESRQLARTYTLTSEAQDAYLRGRYLLDTLSRPNLEKARIEFERVVQLEPLYAPGHASLAMTYLALGNVGVLTPDVVRDLAPAAASTAFNLDPMLAEAALALADVRFRLNWDQQGAEEAYRRAIDLNPSYVLARGQYARFLESAGRTDDALRVAKEAFQIDPLSAEIHAQVGMALYYAHRYDEAIAHYESRPEATSQRTNVGLGRAYAAAGRYAEAIAALTAAVEQSGHDPGIYAELGRTCAQAGQIDRARAILSELDAGRAQRQGYVAPQDLAYVHVALHEYDMAFALLDEAIAEHASRLLWLPVDPRVDPLRQDPRFAALIARLRVTR